MHDQLQTFIINQEEYRGVLVHLNNSYQEMAALHAYPAPIAKLLGEALAGVSLLGHQLKQAGKLALQIETHDSIKLLVAEMNHHHGIRGLVQWRDNIPFTDPLINEGKFAITLMPKQGERYQGIVPLLGYGIAESLESYFTQSEQIFSRLLLACNGKHAAGLLVQRLPTEKNLDLDTETLSFLLKTVKEEELLFDTCEQLLHKLFHEYEVKVFPPEAIHFECTCNHQKMENAVKLLGKEEAHEILSTNKSLEVTCEFCNRHYAFDKAEVDQIFE